MEQKKKGTRILALFLALVMILSFIPVTGPVFAQGGADPIMKNLTREPLGSPKGGNGSDLSNWDNPVPKDDPNYWPIDPDKILPHGAGGLKIAMPTYLGKSGEDFHVGMYFYYGSKSEEYTTLQLRLDTALADKVDSITCKNEESKFNYDYVFTRSETDPLVYEANIGEERKGLIAKLQKKGILNDYGGMLYKPNRVIKIHLKPGTVADRDYLIQTRVVTDKGEVWSKANMHTFSTNISKERQNVPPMGDFKYAASTVMDVSYDAEKGILRVLHKFNHGPIDGTRNPGPAYTSQISPKLLEILPESGPAARTYLVNHENKNAWNHDPLIWTKKDIKHIEGEGREDVAVLKFAGPTYWRGVEKDVPEALLNSGMGQRDPDTYMVHNLSTVNPAGICVEYFIDPVKLTEAFGENQYTQKIAVKGFYSRPAKNEPGADVKMYPNTFANSAVLFEKTFYMPKVNEVFTEDQKVTGKTKYGEAPKAEIPIYVRLPKEKDSFTAKATAEDFEVPVTGLKKDMVLKVSNMNTVDKTRVYVPSDFVSTKVKAHVIFNLNDTGSVKAKFAPDTAVETTGAHKGKHVVVARPNEKDWGEKGYVPNGLNYSYIGEKGLVKYDLMPKAPTREGYKFKGWLLEASRPNFYFSGDTAVEETMEVFADWAAAYEITFDGFSKKENSDIFEENVKVVAENGTLPESSEFPVAKVPVAQQGKKFVGWFTEPGGGGIKVPDETNYDYLFKNGLIVNGKITLYPHFEADPTYTLEFLDKNNGNALVGKMSPKSFSDDFYGSDTRLPSPTTEPAEVTGRALPQSLLQEKILKGKVYAPDYLGGNITYDDIYEFVDPETTTYTLQKSLAQKASDKNQNLIIYLRPKIFNITYKVATNEDGYEVMKPWPKDLDNPNPFTYTFMDPAFKLLGVEREGYVFKGWLPEGNLNVEGTSFRDITVPFNRPENKVYVAGYDKIYKINYINFVPELGDPKYPSSFSANDYEDIIIDEVPKKAGYRFKGWKLNGGNLSDSITIDTMSKSDQRVEAFWEPAYDIESGPTIKAKAGDGKAESAGSENAGKINLFLGFPTGMELGDTIDISYIGEDGQTRNLPRVIINTQEKLSKGWIDVPMDAYTTGNQVASASKEKTGRAAAEKRPPEEGDRTAFTITFKSKHYTNVSKTIKMYYVADTSKLEEAYSEIFNRVYGRMPTADNYKPTEWERNHPLVTVPEMIEKIDEGIVMYEDPGKYPEDLNARPVSQFLIDRWAVEVKNLLRELESTQTKAPSEVTGVNNPGEEFTTLLVKSPTDDPNDKYVEGDRITIQLPDGELVRLTVEKEGEVIGSPLGKAVVKDDGVVTIQLATTGEGGPVAKKLNDGDVVGVFMEKEIAEGGFSPISEITTGNIVDKNPVTGTPVVTVEKPSGNIKVEVNDPLADKVVVNNGFEDITFEKDEEGNWKRTDGSSAYSITQDKDGNIVFVIPTEAEKEQLDGKNVTATISNKDNKTGEGGQPEEIASEPIRYDIKAPAKPTVEKVTAGDTNIKIKTPSENDAQEIIVTVGDKIAVITKDKDGKWKNNDKTFEADSDGNLVIDIDPPVTAEELTPGKEITVKVKDIGGNTSPETTAVVQKQDLPVVGKPTQEGSVVKSEVTETVPEGTEAFLTDEAGNKISSVDGRPITKENGNLKDNPIKGTIADGKIEIPIPDGAKDKLNDKKVKVALEKVDMNPSLSEVGENVLDTINPEEVLPRGTQGAKELQIKVPGDDTEKITVTIPGDPEETVTLEKDGEGWKKDGTPVVVNDEGFLVIPTTNPLPEQQDQKVTIVSEDKVGNATTTEFTPTEKLPTAPPSKVKVVKDGDGYKVIGKAPAGSAVEVKQPNGESYEPKKTATVSSGGEFEIPLPGDYQDGDTVAVTATGNNEKESPAAKAPVDKTPPTLPKIEAKEGDNKVVIKSPSDDATEIKVIIDEKVAVLVKKEDGTWQKEDGTPIPLRTDGSLEIPLPEGETVPFREIQINAKDDAGNSSIYTIMPEAMENTDKPMITEVVKVEGAYKVKGTAPKGATVEIKKPDGTGYNPKKTVIAGENGTFTIDVPEDYTGEDGANTLKLTAKEDGKKESGEITRSFDKTPPEKPAVTAPTLKDPTIKLKKPEEDVIKEVITVGEDPEGVKILLEKDESGNWKTTNPDFTVSRDESGNIIVAPVDDNGLEKINKKNITVQGVDDSGNESLPSEPVQGRTISDLDAPTKVRVNRLNNNHMRVLGQVKPNEMVVFMDGENFINKEDGSAITPEMLETDQTLRDKIATAHANEKGVFKTDMSVIKEGGQEIGKKQLTAHVYTGDVWNSTDVSEGTTFVTPKAVQAPLPPDQASFVSVNKLYNYDEVIRGRYKLLDRIQIVVTRNIGDSVTDYIFVPELRDNGTYEIKVWMENDADANRMHSGDTIRVRGFKNGEKVVEVITIVD